MSSTRTEISQEVIDRLRAQKTEHLRKFFEEGEGYGGDFVINADYEQLKYAATVIAGDIDPVQRAFEEGGLLEPYFWGLVDADGNGVFDSKEADETAAWMQGWCSTVRETWKEVSPKLGGCPTATA
jgi:hypothetical protein